MADMPVPDHDAGGGPCEERDAEAAETPKRGKGKDGKERAQDNAVVVGVRIRPMNPKETEHRDTRILEVTGEAMTTVKTDHNVWTFDHVWDEAHTQGDVYGVLGKRALDSTLAGFNASVFAYGQTGSGKTHSMMGVLECEEEKGLIPRLCEELLERTAAHTAADPEHTYEISMSFLEIYMERVKDLMDLTPDPVATPRGTGATPRTHSALLTPRDSQQTPRDAALGNTSFGTTLSSYLSFTPGGKNASTKPSLRVREHPVHGPYVDGLIMKKVSSLRDILQCIEDGNGVRHTASTNMNNQSSRSHAVFTLHVTHTVKTKAGTGVVSSSRGSSPTNSDGGAVPKLTIPRRGARDAVPATPRGGKELAQSSTSKLVLVDLAGSERQKSTGAVGERLAEGAQINRSLTTLGLVINALAERCTSSKRAFIPYRDSTLTWLLRDTLGGNSRTCMLSTVSPAASQQEETVSTLRYANRAKMIVTQAVVNEDPAQKIIRALREEIEVYKQQVASAKDRADSAEAMAQQHITELEARHLEKLRKYGVPVGSPGVPQCVVAEGEEPEDDEEEEEEEEVPMEAPVVESAGECDLRGELTDRGSCGDPTEEYLRVSLLLKQKVQRLEELEQREEEGREIRELEEQLRQREAAALERERAWQAERVALEEQIARLSEELSSSRAATPVSLHIDPVDLPAAAAPMSPSKLVRDALKDELAAKTDAERKACLAELAALYDELDKREVRWTREKVKLSILINHWKSDSQDLIVALDAESAHPNPSDHALARIKADLGEAEMHLEEHAAFLSAKEAQWKGFHAQLLDNILEQEGVCTRVGAADAAGELRKRRETRTDHQEHSYLLTLLDKKQREIHDLRERVDAPRWAPDDSAAHCNICQRPFTFLYRRHHCRRCGQLVCGECSPFRHEVPAKSGRKIRICVQCNMEATVDSAAY
eukprot:TRINITY_DN1924_c1_g1_i1.p1 TRINITY_DN1924_c1_g1~~TRINITY_DN1924_c1_g1_i1.p1  ORF type:complete len:939 (+),score=385.02 TRINITY_DN1924_c1_g1_i1:78-2894(+)